MTAETQIALTGTPSQIEWATVIRPLADAEFDRVEKAFEEIAMKQVEPEQSETRELIAIVKEKQAEVMANSSAGYFIQEWRELHDQVRQFIARDPRFQAIQTKRAARRQ